jgi:hypothetical protein
MTINLDELVAFKAEIDRLNKLIEEKDRDSRAIGCKLAILQVSRNAELMAVVNYMADRYCQRGTTVDCEAIVEKIEQERGNVE